MQILRSPISMPKTQKKGSIRPIVEYCRVFYQSTPLNGLLRMVVYSVLWILS